MTSVISVVKKLASLRSALAREDEDVGFGPTRDDHDQMGTKGATVLLVPRLATNKRILLDVLGHVEIDFQIFSIHGARDGFAESVWREIRRRV